MTTNPTGRPKRPFTVIILTALVMLLAIGAVISGPMIFLEPSGRLMQWSVEQLKGTPFPDYLIPGLILFLFLGIYPLFVSYALIRQPKWKWPNAINPSRRHHWAWAASWAVGIIALIWIVVETLLLGVISFLQPVVAVWGTLILILAFLPGVRRFHLRPRA